MDRFRFLTAGESHGPTLGAIVEGVPAGLALTEADLVVDLARRQRGYGRGARQTIEQDRARILAGVRHGRTLGSPILLELDDKGKVKSWKAWFHSHGGSASLYLADPADGETLRRVQEICAAKLREPGSGVAAILDRQEVAALGGDPRAELFLDAADGFAISRTPTGSWEGDATDRGYHGFDPRRPAMRASLLLGSRTLAKRGDLGLVPMTRIAPTLAAWLGVKLDRSVTAPLPLFADAAPVR